MTDPVFEIRVTQEIFRIWYFPKSTYSYDGLCITIIKSFLCLKFPRKSYFWRLSQQVEQSFSPNCLSTWNITTFWILPKTRVSNTWSVTNWWSFYWRCSCVRNEQCACSNPNACKEGGVQKLVFDWWCVLFLNGVANRTLMLKDRAFMKGSVFLWIWEVRCSVCTILNRLL